MVLSFEKLLLMMIMMVVMVMVVAVLVVVVVMVVGVVLVLMTWHIGQNRAPSWYSVYSYSIYVRS